MSTQVAPSAASVFLVSGGARGIAAECVLALAERFGCGFALLGRSAPPAREPAWAAGCSDEVELKRRIADQLRGSGERPMPVAVERMYAQLQAGREIAETLAGIEQR